MPAKPPIILLEDDEKLRDLVADGLGESGYPVTALLGPDDLAAELDRLGGNAVLFADRRIGPDGANGFDIAFAALQRFAMLRVIYCSGTQLALKHRALSPRERILLKPFALSQLTTLVRQLHSAPVAEQSPSNC